MSVPAVGDVQILILYDNNPYAKGLQPAWGFSCVVRGLEKTILFDTGGDGSILLSNMQKLGIDPHEVDLVVLSHIHSDHVGGLPGFLQKNREVVVYVPPSFPKSFKRDVTARGTEVMEVHGPVAICRDGYLTGELGTAVREQSLIIHTDRGSIVVTGCAHPGIASILCKAKDLLGDEVLFVTGGFHLVRESKPRTLGIISDLGMLGVRCIGPCHCSGDAARRLFEEEYRQRYVEVGVGTTISVGALP